MTSAREEDDAVAEELPHPPRVPVAFRVGVVGHRPNKLPPPGPGQDALKALIARALVHVRDAVEASRATQAAALYADTPAQLSIVSSLAEGADRLVAEAGIAMGYSLICPLPFTREEFAQDFVAPNALEPGSLGRFEALLATPGATVFELDGSHTAASAAYAYAGQVVLRQSDLLIAIWDGAPAAGGGGTAETLLAALKSRTPVLWLSPLSESGWRLLGRSEDIACLSWGETCSPPKIAGDPARDDTALRKALSDVVFRELELPAPSAPIGGEARASNEERESAVAFFSEIRPVINLAIFWKLFRDAVGSGKIRMPQWRVRPFVEQIGSAWPITPEAPPALAWMNQRLRVHYAWADKTADLNADAYRSGFVLSSLLAAGAVAAALAPVTIGGEQWEKWAAFTELFFVLAVVVIMAQGARRRWHQRWLEYRVLAERIRELRLLTPLGGGRVVTRNPAHLAVYGDPEQSWMAWHARAIARALGLPNVRADSDYARDCLADLRSLCAGQHAFHVASYKRAERINEALHLLTTGLFIVTLAGVALHLGFVLFWPALEGPSRHFVGFLIFAAGAFPAAGAAMAAINNLGEFQRLAKRSRAMAASFEAADKDLQGISAQHLSVRLQDLAPIATRVAEMMVEEVSDWRVVVYDRAASGD